MIQPIDERTLSAIGGQSAVASATAFSQTAANVASMLGDMYTKQKTLQLTKAKYEAETNAANLDMMAKQLEISGNTAIGVQELFANNTNPDDFMNAYTQYRESLPVEVRGKMPDPVQSTPDAIQNWAVSTSQQSKYGVEYIKAQKDSSSTKEWQYLQQLYAERRAAQAAGVPFDPAKEDYIRHVEGMENYPKGTSTPDVEDAFMWIKGFKQDGQEIFADMDTEELYRVSSAVSAEARQLQYTKEKNGISISNTQARTMAIQAMISRGELTQKANITDPARQWLRENSTWAKENLDAVGEGSWIYNPTPGVADSYTPEEAPTPSKGGTVTESDKAQLRALPTGETYTAGDGVTYKKLANGKLEKVQ